MSLTGKQIRELNSAYKSIYTQQESVVEDVTITKEEFEELCVSILAEAFEGNGIEVYDQTDLTPRQIQEAPSLNPKDAAKSVIKQGIKTGLKKLFSIPTAIGIGIGADATTGGNVSRTGLAVANNALPFIRNMYTAVKNNMKYKGTVLQGQDGKYSTADQVRKKTNKESVEFALHIVEDDSIKDLIDKKNKKDQKDSKKDTNVINKDNKDKKDNKKSTDGTAIGNIGFQGTEAEFDKKYNIPPKDEKSNDNIKNDKTTTPPKDDKTTTPPKDDKTTTPPKDDKTTTPPKDDKTTTPPKDDKTTTPPKDDKTTTPPKDDKTTTPPIVTDTDLSKTKEPPKPTNPSGKVIPKPKKPLMKNSPAAKAGIPIETRQKFANMNAAFQATKRKDSGYTKMDFIKDFPNSQTAKKFNKGKPIPGFKYPKKTKKVKADPGPDLKAMSQYSKPKEVTIDDFKSTPPTKKENIKSSYEPYHIVLGYLLHEGHADTINEAHYVMTQMDDETVQDIVALDEGPIATAGAIAGALTLGGMGLNAIKKQLDNKKKMEKGGTFKQGSMMDNIQKKKNMLKNLENY